MATPTECELQQRRRRRRTQARQSSMATVKVREKIARRLESQRASLWKTHARRPTTCGMSRSKASNCQRASDASCCRTGQGVLANREGLRRFQWRPARLCKASYLARLRNLSRFELASERGHVRLLTLLLLLPVRAGHVTQAWTHWEYRDCAFAALAQWQPKRVALSAAGHLQHFRFGTSALELLG